MAILGAVLMMATLLVISDPSEPVVVASGVDRRTRPDVRPTAPPSTAPPSTVPEDTGPDGTGPDGEAQVDPDATVEPIACPADVDPVVCDAAAFVQEFRGRPFRSFPTIDLKEGEAFDAALLADFEGERDGLDQDDALLTAMGLLAEDVDLAAVYRDGLSAGVVGFYDPTTGELVVRGTELNLYAQSVLVHELVHAHDDQWLDLERTAANDDAEYAFSAVVEGNASRVEDAWVARLSDEERSRLEMEELSSISNADMGALFRLPEVVLNLWVSPYDDGLRYVDAVAAAGGEEAVNQALAVPPTTSEDILHLAVAAGPGADPDVEVAAPEVDGTVVDEEQMGELLLREWFGSDAAAGWAGDRYVLWTDTDGRSCVTDLVATDTVADHDELVGVAEAWAQQRPDRRSVTVVTAGDRELVSLSGCA
ncbi:MAG: hypothetical protein ACK5RL_09105 [Acidimicrobiales bacterium]